MKLFPRLMLICLLLVGDGLMLRGQFLDGASGLLQMPSAQLNPSGTFMITNNYMNSHTVPDGSWGWGYDTFGYGFSITIFPRVEVYYTCVIFDGKRKPNPSERDLIMFNQDRHLGGKLQLLREGDFGLNWVPDLVFGINDFDKGMFSHRDAANGFFTRVYLVSSKTLPTKYGRMDAHLGYQFNNWTYYPLSGPCAAVDWFPVWLQKEDVVSVKFIAEYDARFFNVGAIVSLWRNHFELMVDLQAMKWLSAGLRYKVVLK